MSFTNNDDPCLDAEIEGRKARRAGKPCYPHPCSTINPDTTRKMNKAWHAGWKDEDKLIKSSE